MSGLSSSRAGIKTRFIPPASWDILTTRNSPRSTNQIVTERILCSTTSGDAAVNEWTLQPTLHDLPFGGVGNSGMGKYHGEWGFRAYSNARGILSHGTHIDVGGLRYPPYNRNRILHEIVLPS